ncbi:Filamentous hemagglutinin [Labeo rohita]|uniref:Filamentous hemagglutinin n=1 Tax=Labeo rohita TaxID=84645 RepID=A0ABQ8LY70_LABRO|nr:Filamentous hemagglutinin [Labeo rohita]
MSPLRLARGELAPRLSLVSPKVFFLHLSPMEFWFLAPVASGLLTRRDLPFVEYAWEFCRLPMRSGLDDAPINSLHHRMSWREGILRCLESDRPQSRTSPPAHPEPSQPTPQLAEPEPEPPAVREPEPRATEPSAMGVTAREIATEPEPIESDQVREPSTMPATVNVPVGREGAEDSTTHCTADSLKLHSLNLSLFLPDSQSLIDGPYIFTAVVTPSHIPFQSQNKS